VQPDWTTQADELIGAGVTRIDRDKVAAVLVELAGGTAPSTVARKHGVGYATVARIADHRGVQQTDVKGLGAVTIPPTPGATPG